MTKKYDKSRKQPTGRISGRFSSAITDIPKKETPEQEMLLPGLSGALTPEQLVSLAAMLQQYIENFFSESMTIEQYITNIFNEYITNIIYNFFTTTMFPYHGIELVGEHGRHIAVDLSDGTGDPPVVWPGLAFTDTDGDGLGELHALPDTSEGITVTEGGIRVMDGDGIINVPGGDAVGVTADLEAADFDKGGLMFDDINESPDKQLRVKVNAEEGLRLTNTGLIVKPGDGISTDATHGVTADLEDAAAGKGGLEFDDVNSTPHKEIRVKAGGGILLNIYGVCVDLLDENPGLALIGTPPDDELKFLPKPDMGILVDAAGAYVKAGNYIKVDADGVAVIPCGEGGIFVCCE